MGNVFYRIIKKRDWSYQCIIRSGQDIKTRINSCVTTSHTLSHEGSSLKLADSNVNRNSNAFNH